VRGTGALMSKKRSASSKRWIDEHRTDPYVKKARHEGFRSRAVYKLEELDQRDHLLRPGITVVDLGAAPGGWSQYIQRRHGDRIRVLALDVLPMDPVPGVTFIQGDFREEGPLKQLEAAVGGAKVDLVLSDMAPNISGIDAADQAGTMHLGELAVEFARAHLKPGGTLVVKLFQGEGFDEFLGNLRHVFGKVSLRKPKASRSRSSEIYLVARGLRVV
jgi:23S rRNA (uridine2552-2'-O)-methyltransferase